MSHRGISLQSLLALLLIVMTAGAPGCARREQRKPDPASRRVTRSGTIVGFQADYGSHAWLGIPFARPPVGALRWRAPQPPEPWFGTREAMVFGSACAQLGGDGKQVGEEDCLYLNVYSPPFTEAEVPKEGARLPVMLWIHGGSNIHGKGDRDGGNLAATQKLIVITTNYRLGPFGWFRHAALRGEDSNDLDRSGNFGTLDLIQALQWIHENVAAFGGDPGNITISGQSAGGANVFSLLLAPPARGLFHRAIVESGGPGTYPTAMGENFTDDAEPGHANSSNEVLVRLLIKDGLALETRQRKDAPRSNECV